MVRFCQHCQQYVEIARDGFSNTEICSVCGSAMTNVQLASGTIISGFQIIDEIGRGNMGIVYKARQMNLERHVALKILSDELSLDADFVDSFFREARAAASLSHPNIVQAYDAGATAEGIYYLAMELVEGETLDHRISREGCLEPEAALNIAIKLAKALNYAWERQKLSHGDIKPDNVILNSSGDAKLADLGLAKSMHDEAEHHKELMVTPYYAPPELISGQTKQISMKTDMYSFGATLYHMLSGAPPFQHEITDKILSMHVLDKPVPLSKKRPEIKSALSSFVDRLLAKKPEDRPESWEDVTEELEKLTIEGHKKKNKPKKTTKRKIQPQTKQPQAHKSQAMPHPHSRSQPLPEYSITEEPPKAKKQFPTLIVATLLMAIAIILGAIVFVAYKSQEFSPEKKRAEILKQWHTLKTDAQFLPTDKAIVRILDFIKKHKGEVPNETKEFLDALQEKTQPENKKANLTDKFKSDANQLLKELKKIKIEKAQSKKLQTLRLRINFVRNKIKSDEKLSGLVQASDHKLLDEKQKNISSEMAKRLATAKAKQQRKMAKKRKEAKLNYLKKKQAIERKRQARLEHNSMIDSYYTALEEFIKSSSRTKRASKLSKNLKAWLKKYKKIGGTYSQKAQFIADRFSGLIPIESVFILNQKRLKGKELPFNSELAGYMVDEIDEKAIRLSLLDGKVKLGKKVKWSKLNSKEIMQLLQLIGFGDENAEQLSKSHQNSIAASILIEKRSKNVEPTLALLSKLDQNEKESWRKLAEDFRIAPSEFMAIQLWKDMTDSIKAKNYKAATEKLMSINLHCKDSTFYERREDEINRLFRRFKQKSPSAQALYISAKCDKAFEDKEYFVKILDLAMTAHIRYGYLDSISPEIKEKLSRNRKNALSILRDATQIESIADNKLPFYLWEDDQPGEAWSFNKLVRKNSLFKKSDPIVKFLELGSALDIGNWKKARDTLAKIDDVSFLTKDIGPLRKWAPSLLFGYGLAAERFKTAKAQANAANAMGKLVKSLEDNRLKSLATILAMECWMIAGSPEKTLKAAAKCNLSKVHSQKLALKITLLRLLALLQNKDTSSEMFLKELNANSKFFGNDEEFATEKKWCRAAAALMNGASLLDKQKIYNALKYPDPQLKDICARILSASLAKAMHENIKFHDAQTIPKIMETIKAQISGNTSSAILWEKFAILSIAGSGNPHDMKKRIYSLLQDNRICALPFYSRLMLLSAGSKMLDHPQQASAIKEALLKFIDKCPVASDAEVACAEIIYPGATRNTYAQLLENRSAKTAYWAAILGIMSSTDKPSTRKSINKTLQKITPSLSWEEQLLLKKIRNLSE